jgi:alpha-glucosidase (family GH31 glycosyl hydrolase)
MPVVRHLVVDYQDDPNVYGIEDQFTLGDALLLAPILDDQVNAERTVYLPAGTWINLLTGDVVEGGKTVTVKANIAQIPAFLKKDAEDAQALAEIFAGENWKAIQAF